MKKIVLLFTLFAFSFTIVLSQNIPERPNPPRLVNDFCGILTKQEIVSLEKDLQMFANETSTQIVIATFKSLEGYDISDYAIKLGEKWGVGQKNKNNGVVIVLKPKTLNEKGQVFVATGYGIEHLIPDAIANNQIVGNEMIPNFKMNNYYTGLVDGVKVIQDLTKGEYTAEQYKEHVGSGKSGNPLFLLIFILFFVIIPVFRGRRKRYYSAGRSLPFWMAMGMMGANRGSHSGSFSNFSSGSGSFGGFGGFGGGSFGGGGAGGSW